ncbi:MAG: tRNA adenosine(34) deaminase TadA [Rhabdochlamydiaceae bacterium]|nr:tRNA adenosine(34) deaminase TadA [Rhabdochlamydiaceae bacterium]
MRLAITEAEKASQAGEVPVGAVLVYQDKVIASAHNLVEQNKDASLHAEMLCLKEGARILENWRLLDTTLYCTLEPCAMCAGAMLLARVGTLVWGAPDLRHGAHGSWINVLDPSHPTHKIQVRTGVLQEECAELMRQFFRKRRLMAGDCAKII